MKKTVTTYEHPDTISNVILTDGQKYDGLNYHDYVAMGRDLLKGIDCYQARIAFYACKICMIRHGGRSNGFYTLTDYAKELNISHNTLSTWTQIYRHVIIRLGIPLEDLTKKVWITATRTQERLSWENRRDNAEKGTNRKNIKYKPQVSKERVEQIYKEESDDKPSFHGEMRSWSTSISHIKINIFKRDLNLAHEGDILEMMKNLDVISDHLNEFLTKKKKTINIK